MTEIPMPKFEGISDSATVMAQLAQRCAEGNADWSAFRTQCAGLLASALAAGVSVGAHTEKRLSSVNPEAVDRFARDALLVMLQRATVNKSRRPMARISTNEIMMVQKQSLSVDADADQKHFNLTITTRE